MLDLRLYILGALALLSLVSVLYLVVAAIQHAARLVRARRVSAPGAVALEERIDVVPEPVVPLGPPPVLESDPFRNGAPAQAEPRVEDTAVTLPPVPSPAAPAAQAPSPVEPVAEVPEAASESPMGTEHVGEPLSTDQTERIAALLASLEQQAEAEVIAAEPIPAVESVSTQEQPVPVPPPMELAAEPVTLPDAQPPLRPAAEPVPEVAEYRLVAPVELHFTDGSSRVGVRPGARTHDEFQRLANTLLGELRRARSGFEQ